MLSAARRPSNDDVNVSGNSPHTCHRKNGWRLQGARARPAILPPWCRRNRDRLPTSVERAIAFACDCRQGSARHQVSRPSKQPPDRERRCPARLAIGGSHSGDYDEAVWQSVHRKARPDENSSHRVVINLGYAAWSESCFSPTPSESALSPGPAARGPGCLARATRCGIIIARR